MRDWLARHPRAAEDVVFVVAFFVAFTAMTKAFRMAEERGYETGVQAEADRVASEALGG